jgi:hypothetical protein
VLEDLITYSDLLFSEVTEPQAPSLLPPGSGLSRSAVISHHPVHDGPHPGSSRTRVQIVNADTTVLQTSPVEQTPESVNITVNPPMSSPESTMPKRKYTEDDRLKLLFDPGLIPVSMRDGLSEDYHVGFPPTS